ncbi:MAG: flagellar biosynthesis repressor FlbT [Hyphomicrobiales bacterium]|nr:flagellar biosynthesis repressor FlbT [Hyphomicrobiales bacterium]
MRISLRAGERIYLNGAVFSVDRKVSLDLLNDATFLLDAHVMQAQDANTPLRRLYFVLQTMLMDPADAGATRIQARDMFESIQAAVQGDVLAEKIAAVRRSFDNRRLFEALKGLRAAFPDEAELLRFAPPAPLKEIA